MTPDTGQQFATLLQQEIQGAEQLHQILQDESDALVKRDFDAIQSLSKEKSEQSAAMEQLSQQQHQILQNAGLPYSAEGIKRFIDSQPANLAAPLRKHQRQLQTLLESCQKQNLVNGNIIAANRRSAETALSILRGQFVTDNLIYSAGGKTVATSPSKPLTKA